MEKNSQFGLRFNIFLATLLGIKCCHNKEKEWKWINLIQDLLCNCICIVEITFIPLYLVYIWNTFLKFKLSSSNVSSTVIQASVLLLSRCMWIATFSFITIYTRFHSKYLINLVRELLVFHKHFCREAKENYVFFIFCLGLNICFFINFILSVIYGKDLKEVVRMVKHWYSFYGHTFPILFCNLFFSVMENLSSIVENLCTEVHSFQRLKTGQSVLHEFRNLKLSKKKLHLKITKKFSENLVKFYILTEKLFEYFQVPISLIFLNNMIFVMVQGASVATFSNVAITEIFPTVINILHIYTILFIADTLHQKIDDVANILYKMVSLENSEDKRIQIYEICKLLERFPKIRFFGFFAVGRHCLLPILSTFLTYLVIGFQFSVSSNKQ